MSNLDYFGDSLGILIRTDNFMYESLQPAIRQHQKCRPLMTMVTFISSNPQSCGIVEIDSQGIVQSYYEKSANPPGNMANGAIYIFDHRFVEYLRVNYEYKTQITDISSEIIPRLVGQIQVCHTDKMFADIGTLESYKTAQEFYKKYGIE